MTIDKRAIHIPNHILKVQSNPDFSTFDALSRNPLYSDPLFVSPLTPPSVPLLGHHTWDGRRPKDSKVGFGERLISFCALAICGPSFREERAAKKTRILEKHRKRHDERYKHKTDSIRYYYVKNKKQKPRRPLAPTRLDEASAVNVNKVIAESIEPSFVDNQNTDKENNVQGAAATSSSQSQRAEMKPRHRRVMRPVRFKAG
jgi:hypothetical protein